MKVRARCLRDGHKYAGIEGVSLPFIFCRRWFCDASRVNPDHSMPDEMRETFRQTAEKMNAKAEKKVVPW